LKKTEEEGKRNMKRQKEMVRKMNQPGGRFNTHIEVLVKKHEIRVIIYKSTNTTCVNSMRGPGSRRITSFIEGAEDQLPPLLPSIWIRRTDIGAYPAAT
jgi:hypothetical protein